MSWFVKAMGKPAAVKAALEKQFENGKCMEPEETARQAAKTAMLAVVGAYPANIDVLAHGYGSQSRAVGQTETAVGEFTMRVECLNSMLT